MKTFYEIYSHDGEYYEGDETEGKLLFSSENNDEVLKKYNEIADYGTNESYPIVLVKLDKTPRFKSSDLPNGVIKNIVNSINDIHKKQGIDSEITEIISNIEVLDWLDEQ